MRFLIVHDRPGDPTTCDRHYGEVHAPLIRQPPGLRRFTVSREIAAVQGEPMHLVAELQWDDLESLRVAFATPEGRAVAVDVASLGAGGVPSTVYELEDLL